ncbi:hypothetical protein FGO68_gene11277 [Halteria grandinella]|uniref:Uncharacterized protein n=1 Tax=Halteria grandinella TaxID=5974 RepID=A0A8J8NPD6_HALGN|nr:hypothetical protein FGO68_gene11277 [Halteria grandinella]
MQEESTLNSSQAPSTQVAVEQTELKKEFQRDAIRLKISKRPTPLINLKPPGSTGGLTAHTLTADGRFSMKSQELRVLQPPLPQNSEIFNRKFPVAPAAPETLPEDNYIIIQQSYVPDCSTRLEKSIHQRLDKLGIFAVDVKNSLEQYFKPPVIGKSALQLELAKKQQSRLTAKSTVNVTDVASVVQSLSGNKPTLNTGLSGLAARRNLLKYNHTGLLKVTFAAEREAIFPGQRICEEFTIKQQPKCNSGQAPRQWIRKHCIIQDT